MSRNGRSPMSLEIVHEDMSFGRKVVKLFFFGGGLGWENAFFLSVKCVWFGLDMR